MNAVSAVQITLTTPVSAREGQQAFALIKTDVALLHVPNEKEPPVLLGKAELNRTWPEKVVRLASDLRDAIEDHLLQVYFTDERKEDGKRGDFPIDIPTGLGGSGLVDPEDEPEQL